MATPPYDDSLSSSRGIRLSSPRRDLPSSDVPPAPHNSLRASPELPLSDQEDGSWERDVLASQRSAASSQFQRSFSSSSLAPAQQPRSPDSTTGATAASGDVVHLRAQLQRATRHLVWLATSVGQLPDLHPAQALAQFAAELQTSLTASLSIADLQFRHELSVSFPHPLTNASEMSVVAIARVLLPHYEAWRTDSEQ